MLITGGAGFIGANAAVSFARQGWSVSVLDNLSRRGADENLRWVRENASIEFAKADVRDAAEIARIVTDARPDVVLHLAGQVAVTTSVANPREDFEINALGTLNILEAVRAGRPAALVLYASTNKVYGRMEHVGVVEREGRYGYRDLPEGVAESQPLDFHSPYGCSKGAADQYVLDYHKSYGLRTVTLRQSCIYGPRQFGVEDQGWVAWFLIAAVLGRPITIFGDGKQVRDVLHVDDLLSAYQAVISAPERAVGQSFNIGGGRDRTLSLLELIALIEEQLGTKLNPRFDEWRVGDQPVFVCDLRKAVERLSWRPEITCRDGVVRLLSWVRENARLFEAGIGA